MKAAAPVEFDGYALLQEQADFLASSSPADINSTTFLKVKLASQQKRTAQRNQFNRSLKSSGGAVTSTTPSANLPAGTVHPNYNSYEELPLGSQNNSFGNARKSWTPSGSQLEDGRAEPLNSFDSGSAANKLYGSAPWDAEEFPAGSIGAHHVDPNAPKHALDEIPAVASGIRASMPEVEEVVLIPCPYCGRNFAEDRIERHCIACMKLNKMEAHRRHKQQQQQHQQRREGAWGGAGSSSQMAEAPATDWRKQSSQLRGALNGETVEDDRVPCPYCRRRFAAETASRHIPLCKEKMTRLK